MIKFKHVLVFAILLVLVYACGEDNGGSGIDNFDYEAQALKDNDSIVSFLKKHYYDADVDSVKVLVSGKTALFNDEKLKVQEVTEDDVDYKLYYYVQSEGGIDDQNNIVGKGNPSVADSVYVNYYGQRIVNTDSLSVSFDSNKGLWLVLTNVIKGWSYGFTHFKGGKNITDNGPITYAHGGKGLLFIPSGLGYSNRGAGGIPANTSLMFNIDLFELVPETDLDNDGVPSIFEDPDGDGKPWTDDTDSNFIPNYLDADDDGDGVPTIQEDANGDGNPRNDFNDPNNPELPDYLNRNIRIRN